MTAAGACLQWSELCAAALVAWRERVSRLLRLQLLHTQLWDQLTAVVGVDASASMKASRVPACDANCGVAASASRSGVA